MIYPSPRSVKVIWAQLVQYGLVCSISTKPQDFTYNELLRRLSTIKHKGVK